MSCQNAEPSSSTPASHTPSSLMAFFAPASQEWCRGKQRRSGSLCLLETPCPSPCGPVTPSHWFQGDPDQELALNGDFLCMTPRPKVMTVLIQCWVRGHKNCNNRNSLITWYLLYHLPSLDCYFSLADGQIIIRAAISGRHTPQRYA